MKECSCVEGAREEGQEEDRGSQVDIRTGQPSLTQQCHDLGVGFSVGIKVLRLRLLGANNERRRV